MKKLITIASLLAGFTAYSQELHEFHVLAENGENTVRGNHVFAGFGFTFNDTLKVSKGAYVGIIHKSGYCIEIKEEGLYAITDLAAKTDKTHAGVGYKYSNYVLEHFTQKEKKPSLEKMANVNPNAEIKVLLPKQSEYIFDEIADIHWFRNKKVKSYKVNVSDKTGKLLSSHNSSDTTFALNLKGFNIGKEHQLKLTITSEDGKVTSDEFMLHVITGEKAKSFETVLQGMQKELHTETAIGKVLLASYCEHHKLYAQAVNYYEDATKLEPTVEAYESLYTQFLHRVGIVY